MPFRRGASRSRAATGAGMWPSISGARSTRLPSGRACARRTCATVSVTARTCRASSKRAVIVERQRQERAELERRQQERAGRESAARANRLNKGFRGIWDRLTGAHGRTARQNELEAWEATQRDRRERDALIEAHLDERQGLHLIEQEARDAHGKEVLQLHRDIAGYTAMQSPERPDAREAFRDAASGREGRERGSARGFGRERERGPEPER